MRIETRATYVLWIYGEGARVVGPNENRDATAAVIAACNSAETLDDMPTVTVAEAEEVLAAFSLHEGRERLDSELVAVCRVAE
jgi:hypothetical protein